ncbi:MAG TPA: PQQ-binding-like beta-propeller repeat protein, partial [Candidatus Dormibacteraeota bacterium]|nr:PQQ-binding-like beta-propeller repeat protein [Candidatus Dormibacteraeota bacterium]
GNSAYIGIASLGDCPLVQGQLLRVDLTTHLVAASVSFVPNGQVGGGIWTTPAIDTATNTVFVTTGTLNQASQTLSEAMVALDATTLAVKSSWQIPRSVANADSDWGTSPILFADANGRQLVAGIDKNGFLYAFDRSNLAIGPVWSRQVAISGICPTCGDGSVSSMAFAQGLLFAAGGNTTIGGTGYPGGIRAIDPTSGNVVWEHGLASPVVPALAYDDGVVFAGVGPRREAFDASSGARLFSAATSGTIFAPPTISNGTVYVGSGDSSLWAFQVATPTTPSADPACPSGWTCQDIGSASPGGSETVSAGSWSISAGGAGLGGTASSDQARFMSEPASGDLQLTARVASQASVASGTQTGIMVRQANDAGSPFYAVSVLGGTTAKVQYRTSFGGALKTASATITVPPEYLEIQRVGDTFVAATSGDGSTWTLVPGGTAMLSLPTATMAGIVAASGLNGTAASSTVDTVTLGPPGSPPSPPASPSPCPTGWSCTDIGSPVGIGDQTL